MFSGTETQHIDDALLQERLFAKLTGFFGLAAMPLACVRLYGILSHAVLRRTSEIAIRMALGRPIRQHSSLGAARACCWFVAES